MCILSETAKWRNYDHVKMCRGRRFRRKCSSNWRKNERIHFDLLIFNK